jgi:hypothetical protein
MSSERPLSYRDTAKVLARLGDDLQIVLVGGQAVNFWAEHYRARASDLGGGPFTSADIDFTGTRQAVVTSAERLNGRALLPEAFAPPPSSGVVIFRDDAGFEHTIDFLTTVHGLDDGVHRRSVPVEILDEHGSSTGARFRVMQPVDCLWSRVHNVTGLPGYDTPHGLAQARATVVCAREFVRDVADSGRVREALRLNERIFELCSKARAGREIYAKGIDPFAAVLKHPGFPPEFEERRFPQMADELRRRGLRT